MKACQRHFEGIVKARWMHFKGVLKIRHFEDSLKARWRSFQCILMHFAILLENQKNSGLIFLTFSKTLTFAKFRQKFIKLWAKFNHYENVSEINLMGKSCKILPKSRKCEKVWGFFSEILRSERCKSMY